MKKYLLILLLSFTHILSNAQTWTGVGSGLDGSVDVLDSCMGKLFVGGRFATAGGINADHIAAWDGANWTALDSGLNGQVSTMTNYDGKLIVGGLFTKAGNKPVRNIAMWDGTQWTALGSGISGGVNSMVVYNGNLYAGGSFDSAGNVLCKNIAEWNGSNWLNLGTGLRGDAYSSVNALAVYNGTLYAGGYFDTANSIETNNIAYWNGTAWDSLNNQIRYGGGCPNYTVFSLAVYDNLLYVGGTLMINTPHGLAFNLADWNGGSWDTATCCTANTVWTMVVYRNYLFAGGAPIFPFQDIAVLHGSHWDSLGNGIISCHPQMNCSSCSYSFYTIELNAIAGYNGALFAGGSFSTTYGNQASYLEQYNGPLSVNDISSANKNILVEPNPSTGVFNFQMRGNSTNLNYVVAYNMMGQEVYSQNILSNHFLVDLSNHALGIYFYRIISSSGTCIATGKLVKE
jgi:hypothetical protein